MYFRKTSSRLGLDSVTVCASRFFASSERRSSGIILSPSLIVKWTELFFVRIVPVGTFSVNNVCALRAVSSERKPKTIVSPPTELFNSAGVPVNNFSVIYNCYCVTELISFIHVLSG